MQTKIWLAVGVGIVMGGSAAAAGEIRWQDRVLPLPQEMAVAGYVETVPGRIAYDLTAVPAAPVTPTIEALLGSFAHQHSLAGWGNAQVLIEAVQAGRAGAEVSEALRARLDSLPNADQAYAIESQPGDPTVIRLVAHTPVGLLNAARTLHQLVQPPAEINASTTLIVPLADIVDWPDIAQRGEWGSSGYYSLDWYSRWKLNMHRVGTRSYATPSGDIIRFHEGYRGRGHTLERPRAQLDWAATLGYIMVPYKGHLGHSSGREWRGVSCPGWSAEELSRRPRPQFPGFDWSDPAINRLLEAHMRRLVAMIDGQSRDIGVWLSEFSGHPAELFLEETRAILRAFAAIRSDHPDLRLRILLGQGSEAAGVHEDIIALLPEDVGLGFYSAGSTYVTDRQPMIPPELEAFARAGGWLEVVPQVVPNIRAHFPGSMPQFIRFRATEFADKQLSGVISYCLPDRFYHQVNMAALGEYTWNAHGRSVRDFARAYATIKGLPDPVLYADWVEQAGEAAWDLVAVPSGHGYMASLGRGVFIEEGELSVRNLRRWGMGDNRGAIEDALARAREALRLSRAPGATELMQVESDAVLAALESILLLVDAGERLERGEIDERLGAKLESLDACGHLIRAGIYDWHRLVTEKKRATLPDVPAAGAYRPGFLQELPGDHYRSKFPAYAVLYAVEELWQRAIEQGLPDSRGDRRPVRVAAWSAEEAARDTLTLEIDLGDQVPPEGGTYLLGYEYGAGRGLRVRSAVLLQPGADGDGALELPRPWVGLARRTRRFSGRGMRLEIPPRAPKTALALRLEIAGAAEAGAGHVTLRRLWQREDIDARTMQWMTR